MEITSRLQNGENSANSTIAFRNLRFSAEQTFYRIKNSLCILREHGVFATNAFDVAEFQNVLII